LFIVSPYYTVSINYIQYLVSFTLVYCALSGRVDREPHIPFKGGGEWRFETGDWGLETGGLGDWGGESFDGDMPMPTCTPRVRCGDEAYLLITYVCMYGWDAQGKKWSGEELAYVD